MKGLPLRRPETNMRCLLTSWDRCGVKSAIILEQTYWWTITGAASSLRSQTTILCRQSSWILWTPENLPHPGSTLVWRQFFFLLQVSYIFGDMSEYVLIKLKQDWSAWSRQKRFPIIHLLPCIFLAFASKIFVSYHPGVLHMYWSNWSTTDSARVIVPYCLKLPNKCSTLCFSLRLLAGWQCLTCATFIAIKSTKPVLQAKGQKELLEKFVMKFSGPFWFLIITASCAI